MSLTLPDAIQHALEQAGATEGACSEEHLQLAKYLQELQVYRQRSQHQDDDSGTLDPEELLDVVEEEELLLADGLEGACIGIARQFNRPMVAYDRGACIRILMAQGMTHDDAEEYFEFNTQGAWVGDKTPVFIELLHLHI